ncbi:MAG: cupin domain-containing protein [Candidatus Jordarchaeum sp.]|uniref:cupin domain-containing protein n=1 Tax=Candidatus Jordarchaeum sp. TaxID=2823881 RepID=UPI004049CE4F
MLKKNYHDVAEEDVTLAGSTGATIRWLITEKDGALRYAMRRFEIKPGGHIGLHNHPEEHEIYVMSGKARIFNDKGEEFIAGSGDVLFVPPNEKHGYENLVEETFTFLCVIPILEKK